jgi:flagellar biosynthesis protein FlhG
MADQASVLRNRMSVSDQLLRQTKAPMETRVIAVASGKGGVGKSNFCINFALALMEKGFTPIVIDTDVGFANVEVLLGTRPSYSLLDVLEGTSVWDVIHNSPTGLPFLSAGNGMTDIHSLTEQELDKMMGALRALHERYNVIILDSGAGMGARVSRLIGAADELILITTPEPTSITDAYALVKMLSTRDELPPTRLVVNRAMKISDAKIAADKLTKVTERFLSHRLDVLGFILEDEEMKNAVMRQYPLYYAAPNSRAARCFAQLSTNYVRMKEETPRFGLTGFLHRLFGKRTIAGSGGVDFVHQT